MFDILADSSILLLCGCLTENPGEVVRATVVLLYFLMALPDKYKTVKRLPANGLGHFKEGLMRF